MSTIFVLLFLGGGDFFNLYLLQNPMGLTILYDFFLGIKIILIAFMFVFIRANLPRFRFDQLMFIG